MKLPEPTIADLRRAKEFIGEESLLLAQWAAEERRRILSILRGVNLTGGPSGWEIADYLKEETDNEI
jgi:hypothetical protein